MYSMDFSDKFRDFILKNPEYRLQNTFNLESWEAVEPEEGEEEFIDEEIKIKDVKKESKDNNGIDIWKGLLKQSGLTEEGRNEIKESLKDCLREKAEFKKKDYKRFKDADGFLNYLGSKKDEL